MITAHESSVASRRPFIRAVCGAVLVGMACRLYLFKQQVLLDDEWHTMSFVLDQPLAWVLTHFSVPSGFTSIPLNLHAWALLHSVGWSESLLRAPSMIAGLLGLAVAPLLARSLLGTRAAGTLALLLAISPVLVFYSRLARPYSVVACLGFIAILGAARWNRTGRGRDGVLFAVCGVLAVYWHPLAAVAVATTGVALWLAGLARRAQPGPARDPAPTLARITVVLLAMGLAGAILLAPALVDSLRHSMADVAQKGHLSGAGLLRFASLTAGTANPILVGLFWGLAVAGLLALWRRNAWLAATILAMLPLQFLVLLAMRPHSCHVGIVLVRYGIVLVPVALLLVASGLQALLDALSCRIPLSGASRAVLAGALAAAFVLAGPLPRTWSAPNNFTNHGAFQHNAARLDWSRSFDSEFAPPGFPLSTVVRAGDISGFYRLLHHRPGDRPIVEWPMLIGDHCNPLYFYQRHHQRPVIVGYGIGLVAPAPLKGGGVYGNTYADDVVNRVADPARLKFHNMIDITDYDGMRARGVEYVVLHKRFEADIPKMAPPPAAFDQVLARGRANLPLVHEDALVAVFALDPAKERP